MTHFYTNLVQFWRSIISQWSSESQSWNLFLRMHQWPRWDSSQPSRILFADKTQPSVPSRKVLKNLPQEYTRMENLLPFCPPQPLKYQLRWLDTPTKSKTVSIVRPKIAFIIGNATRSNTKIFQHASMLGIRPITFLWSLVLEKMISSDSFFLKAIWRF